MNPTNSAAMGLVTPLSVDINVTVDKILRSQLVNFMQGF
jgi:hypothetical protein